jgi:HEAT repeat protein
LASDTSIDVAQRLALLLGLGSLGLTFGLIVLVGLMRLALRWRERAAAATIARWRPALLRHAMGEDPPFPPLRRAERAVLLMLWNQIAESLRGPSHDRLRVVLNLLGLNGLARRWLMRRNRERQWLGLVTLGHLAQPSDWDAVHTLLGDARPYLSLSAARALLQIDPARAAVPVLAEIARRPEWPMARLALLLREAGAQHLFAPLRERLLDADTTQQVRLVRLLAAVDSVRASPTLLGLLERSDHTELLSMCLQHVQTPAALPRVRQLAQHPVWWVRSQAAAALARFGTEIDKPLLLTLLSDPQWWVRYRAAQALLCTPGVTRAAALELRDTLTDRYARDVLGQAMVEREMA